MNATRRYVLAAGLAACALMGLFPPWRFWGIRLSAPVFSPPYIIARGSDTIDWSLLALEWLAAGAATAAVMALAPRR